MFRLNFIQELCSNILLEEHLFMSAGFQIVEIDGKQHFVLAESEAGISGSVDVVASKDNFTLKKGKDGRNYFVLVHHSNRARLKPFETTIEVDMNDEALQDVDETAELQGAVEDIMLKITEINETYDSMEESLDSISKDTKARDLIKQMQNNLINA